MPDTLYQAYLDDDLQAFAVADLPDQDQLENIVGRCMVEHKLDFVKSLVSRGANIGMDSIVLRSVFSMDPEIISYMLIDLEAPQNYGHHDRTPMDLAIFWLFISNVYIHADAFITIAKLLLTYNPISTRLSCGTYIASPLPATLSEQRILIDIYQSLNPCIECGTRHESPVALAARGNFGTILAMLLFRGNHIPRNIPYHPLFGIATLPWKPHTHFSGFPEAFRNHVLAIHIAMPHVVDLPYLPLEMWLTIMGFTCRHWFCVDLQRISVRDIKRTLQYFRV